eukprot:INCI18420.2.p1 GENE.INCI18420.2~~INCI18420.2.p1  ORF type:complete len:232 (+),score=19.23 INCI18420.2:116-811(+)
MRCAATVAATLRLFARFSSSSCSSSPSPSASLARLFAPGVPVVRSGPSRSSKTFFICQTRVSPLSQMASSSSSSSTPLEPKVYMDSSNNAIVIEPSDPLLHTATVVGPIHGLGDSARGWLDGALMLWRHVPHCKMILPNAPVAPVTLNGGMRMPSWYDIVGGGGDRFSEPCAGLDESRARINALIDAEVASGIPASRIALAGFSQGGAMTLVCGLQYPATLAGCLVMSGCV